METARKVILFGSLAAVAFFGFLLLMLSSDPSQFEDRLRNFAIATVKAETVQYAEDRGITLPGGEATSAIQERLAEQFESRSANYSAALEARVDEIIADALAKACSLDCERRESVRRRAQDYMEGMVERYDIGARSMRDFAVGQYEARVQSLHRDLVIVATTNIVVFLMIVLLTAKRTPFMPFLLKIACLALISALTLLIWYVLGQDWMTTLIFNDFIGMGYAVFLGILFLCLCDLALNEARILSAIAEIFGHSLSVVSC